MRSIARFAAAAKRRHWISRNRSAFVDGTSRARPRLLVDVSTILHQDAQTGIQRVVRAVWSELMFRSGREFDVVPVYATASAGYCYAPAPFLTCRPSELRSDTVRGARGDTFLGLDLGAHLLPKYREQIAAWRQAGATVHLLVYDLLPLMRPEWFSGATVRNFRDWFDFLGHGVDQAICISEKVAADLRKELKGREAGARLSIARLQMAADIASSVPSRGTSSELLQLIECLRFRPAILMVGTIEPRKGYEQALDAFEHLWSTRPSDSPDLVIVGKRGWKTEALQHRLRSHPQFGRRLYWLADVSDEGLCLLYETSRGLLVASHDEGFGLPLMEAAAHARWVLARDLPVFREQRLVNVVFYSDDAPDSLAGCLMELAAMAQAGPPPLMKLPTWSECVDGLLRELTLTSDREGCRPASLRKAS